LVKAISAYSPRCGERPGFTTPPGVELVVLDRVERYVFRVARSPTTYLEPEEIAGAVKSSLGEAPDRIGP